MEMITWSDDLVIDNGLIDDQHKMAIYIINRFIEMRRHFRSPAQAIEILDTLKTLTKYHFAYEEEVQRKINYPLCDQHSKMHVKLDNQLDRIIVNLKKTNGENLTEISMETGKYLKRWLVSHILVHDMDMKPYIQNKDAWVLELSGA
jgi:hemerythrin